MERDVKKKRSEITEWSSTYLVVASSVLYVSMLRLHLSIQVILPWYLISLMPSVEDTLVPFISPSPVQHCTYVTVTALGVTCSV